MIKIHKLPRYTWIEVVEPKESELSDVIDNYQLPRKFKNYMLDKHEQPRANYDDLTDFGVLVIRALTNHSGNNTTTVPIFIGFDNRVLITVCHGLEQSQLIKIADDSGVSEISEHIFSALLAILSPYFDNLDEISQKAEKLEGIRGRGISNRNLDALSILKTNLVYLRSATAGNLIALQDLQGILKGRSNLMATGGIKVNQQIADLIVEYKQCQTMFDVEGDVVSETESAFGNILNNKLNQTMQFLTVWSLILAIPPIISGFYGMNVKLPFAGRTEAWFDTLILTLVFVLGMVLYLKIKKRF